MLIWHPDFARKNQSATPVKLQNLSVPKGSRYIIQEDGKPFFWLGDTAWELFHRLTLEEVEIYLKNRAAKGFNMIQSVALAEFKPYVAAPEKDWILVIADSTKPWAK